MKKLISLILCIGFIAGCFGMASVCAEQEYKYQEQVYELLNAEKYEQIEDYLPLHYRECFEYFSDTNTSDVPDYVLIDFYTNMFEPMLYMKIIGDYIFWDYSRYIPDAIGYFIYLPAENELYSLSGAYKANIEGIDKVFTEYGAGVLIGDADNDNKLTIKDASLIQKALAGLVELDDSIFAEEGFAELSKPGYVSDYDRDGERTVKDVSAIQKAIAGLDISAPDAE